MSSNPSRYYRISLFALALAIALPVIKIFYISYTTKLSPVSAFSHMAATEAALFSTVVLLSLLVGKNKKISAIPQTLVALMLLWYGADLLSILFLNNRANPSVLLRVSGDAAKLSSAQKATSVALVTLCLAAPFVQQTLSLRFIRPLSVAALFGFAFPLIFSTSPDGIQDYYESPSLRWLISPLANNQLLSLDTSSSNPKHLSNHDPWSDLEWRKDNPDVILLIIESLSTVDSLRSGGITNHLPKFDELSKRGAIFTNAIANYYDTEGGLISLLNGVPPLPERGNSRDLFRIYSQQPSIVPLLSERGYRTEFYTTADLSFLKKGDYLKHLGFSVTKGRDEVPEFKEAPRYSFNAPADALLYRELLKVIDHRSIGDVPPLFLTAITVSSHLPWTDPRRESDNEFTVWRYVDDSLNDFTIELEKRNYFENGVLIITGDHRKMTPVSADEHRKFGATAPSRVCLSILGKGFPPNTVNDNLLQQSDILRYLDRLSNNSLPLSRDIVIPDRFSRPWLREGELIARFRLIQSETPNPAASHFGWIAGSNISWETAIPPRAHTIERAIVSQREALGSFRNDTHNKQERVPCNPAKGRLKDSLNSPHLFTTYALPNATIGEVDLGQLRSPLRVISQIDFKNVSQSLQLPKAEDFGLIFLGKVTVEREGWHYFRIESDDGACLLVNDKEVINANYPRQFGHSEGGVYLKVGEHSLELRYFQRLAYAAVSALWSTPEHREWHLIGK